MNQVSTRSQTTQEGLSRQSTRIDYASEANLPARARRPEAVALLAEIMARLHDVDLPIIQMIAACQYSSAFETAHELAAACVSNIGRTLLLTGLPSGNVDEGAFVTNHVGVSQSSARTSWPILPDMEIPGLYHRQLDGRAFDPAKCASHGSRSASKAFKMVVVISQAPSVFPAASSIASKCNGSVVTVAAGVTRLQSLQATVRQLQHAGGTVLGTVLCGAPNLSFASRRLQTP